MKRTKTKSSLLSPIFKALSDGLTPAAAKRLLAVKPSKQHLARMTYLADQCNEGLLTPDERAEYTQLVEIGTELSILRSKARQLLARASLS